jgi:hypothetical protein
MRGLGETHEILATNVTGTHIGNTTIELVVEKVRAVVGRKEAVVKNMEDTTLDWVESHSF